MKGRIDVGKAALRGLIAANLLMFTCYFVLQKLASAGSPVATLAEGDSLVQFSGVDLKGNPWTSRDAACHLVRITDDGCEYCQKDKPLYEAVIREAIGASCDIVEIAPRAGGMALNERPGVVQLKLLDADIGAQIFPFVTPQTILVDKNWEVQMTRRGAFDAKSLERMQAHLKSIKESGALR